MSHRPRITSAAFNGPVGVSSSSTLARAARMNPWEEKNRRRIRLIEKKYNGGLDDHEMAELSRLKREVSVYVRLIAPRSSEVLDEQAARLERLKRKAEAEASA